MMTIPFSVDGSEKECLIQIRDLVDNRVVADVFHGRCQPGVHSAEFDPKVVFDGLDAGYYALYLIIGDEVESYPLQYMP
ncbi:MAG: hypothetical protein JST22_02205 [Bacteroidetes bacterium]|nr:hypothetical protein [Bacteroidota bacterium]HVZ38563.1 hypothetical protein [Candidatus Kapabacteria bacterium]